MFYIILLGMVAGFLALRLYMVLGKRTGHEQPLPKPADERLAPTAMVRPIEPVAESRDVAQRSIEAPAEAGLRAIVAAEPGFDVTRFIDGARAAYRMILEAYWSANMSALEGLVDETVHKLFADAIADRATAGHVLDNRLVSVEHAVIADASVSARVARITVRFDADIAAITRDADGQLISGSLSDAVGTHDLWTFSRTLKSGDPNWKLTDTDEV